MVDNFQKDIDLQDPTCMLVGSILLHSKKQLLIMKQFNPKHMYFDESVQLK